MGEFQAISIHLLQTEISCSKNKVISIKLSFCFSFQPLLRSLDTVRTEINSVPVVFLLGDCSHRN